MTVYLFRFKLNPELLSIPAYDFSDDCHTRAAYLSRQLGRVRETNLPQMYFSGPTTRGSARTSTVYLGPVAPTRGRHLASRREANVCLSGTNVCKEPMLQQLSQGCAPHTNEGIDRFPRCTVVSRSLKWCTNLQLEQGWLIPVDFYLFIYLTNILISRKQNEPQWQLL